MKYACTNCDSENIKHLSGVYQGGIANVTNTTVGGGVGFASGGLGYGVGTAVTSGVSQSAASISAAPPARMRMMRFRWWFVLVLFALTIIYKNGWEPYAWIIFLACLFARSVYQARQYNQNIWPGLRDEWEHSYLCGRCNQISVLREG
jgi:hypothetical protein